MQRINKGSVQKQHNRGYAVFGIVRDLGIFIDLYIMYMKGFAVFARLKVGD